MMVNQLPKKENTKPCQSEQRDTITEALPSIAPVTLHQLYDHSPNLKTLCKPLGRIQYWPANRPLTDITGDLGFNLFAAFCVTGFWLLNAFLLLGVLSLGSDWVVTPFVLFLFVGISGWLHQRMRLLYSREILLVGDKGALYAWQESTGRILRYKQLMYGKDMHVALASNNKRYYLQIKRPRLNLAVSLGDDEAQCRAAHEALYKALYYFNYRNVGR